MKFYDHFEVEGLRLPYGVEDTTIRHAVVRRRFLRNPEAFLASAIAEARAAGEDWDSTLQNDHKHQRILHLYPSYHVGLFQRFERVILPLNDKHFGLELTYWHPARINVYPAGLGEHKPHSDYQGPEPAKLAFSVLLADCERGGGLTVDNYGPVDLRPGDLAVFPAYETHRVDRVEAGERVSLTGWAGGPPLR